MTTNAILTYLGIALAFPAAVFLALGVRGPRSDLTVLPTRRADIIGGAMLLAAAAGAELISLAHGGPAAGERSGNTAGGIVAVVLVGLFCLIVCLVAHQFVLGHFRRKLDDQEC